MVRQIFCFAGFAVQNRPFGFGQHGGTTVVLVAFVYFSEPEQAPCNNAFEYDVFLQAIRMPQLGFFHATAGFEYFVEHFNIPAP